MNRIKKLRKEQGLTVADLSAQIGISQSMLSNYENGNSQPRDQEVWKKLAEVLGVDVGYLMGFSNRRPISMEKASNILNSKEELSNVSLTLAGIDSAFLTDDDISIQDIYEELSNPKKNILFEVAQSLLAAEILSKSVLGIDSNHNDD